MTNATNIVVYTGSEYDIINGIKINNDLFGSDSGLATNISLSSDEMIDSIEFSHTGKKYHISTLNICVFTSAW